MWEIIVAFQNTVDIHYFLKFGRIERTLEMTMPNLNELRQVINFEDFGKFMSEDLRTFRYVKFTFSTISSPGVDLYRALQGRNKMKFNGVSFYVVSHRIPLPSQIYEAFERDLLAEFGIDTF
jgi:hypothetical protein